MCFGKKPKPQYASSGGYSEESIRPMGYVYELLRSLAKILWCFMKISNALFSTAKNTHTRACQASQVYLFSEAINTTRVLFLHPRLDSTMAIQAQDLQGKFQNLENWSIKFLTKISSRQSARSAVPNFSTPQPHQYQNYPRPVRSV
jgi:hypothetical protein